MKITGFFKGTVSRTIHVSCVWSTTDPDYWIWRRTQCVARTNRSCSITLQLEVLLFPGRVPLSLQLDAFRIIISGNVFSSLNFRFFGKMLSILYTVNESAAEVLICREDVWLRTEVSDTWIRLCENSENRDFSLKGKCLIFCIWILQEGKKTFVYTTRYNYVFKEYNRSLGTVHRRLIKFQIESEYFSIRNLVWY